MTEARHSVTGLLEAHRQGEPDALDRLFSLVYDELRDLAHFQLYSRRSQGGMETTALVHELYFKLVDQDRGWNNRGHFFGVCAKAMRRLVVDQARHRVRAKRGGGQAALPLAEEQIAGDSDPQWILQLDQLMNQLARHDPRLVRIFECRYFCGFSVEETAEAVGVSTRTVERDWRRVRGWLGRALTEASGPDGPSHG